MGTVIGPISREDWFLMSSLKGNLGFYQKTDPNRYDLAIKKTKELYSKTLGAYLTGEAA
jgi:hypothetical protein